MLLQISRDVEVFTAVAASLSQVSNSTSTRLVHYSSSNASGRIDAGEIEGFIAATTITNIYYIVRRVAGRAVAQDTIIQVLNDLNICAVDLEILEQALALNFEDFEDAVQYACAVAHGVDAIVTRDASGFINAEISVILPEKIETINSAE